MSLSRYLAAALTAGLLLMAVAAEGQKSVADEVYSHAILNGHETDKKGLMDALLDMYAAKNLLSSAAAFEAYVGVLAKGYTVGSEEWNLRLEIFSDNLAFIAGHNSNEGASFSLGINEFSDWTASEFKSAFVTGMSHQGAESWTPPDVPNPDKEPARYHTFAYENFNTTVRTVDWRKQGVVGPVKNQHVDGSPCGCCWAFSAVAAMETAHALSTGQPALSLSEQQLISCDFHPGREDMNEGCKGGYWWKAMDYSINNGGLNTEENYPYLGRDATCDFEKAKKDNKGFLSGYEFIDTLNETAMIATVANQPTLIEVCVGDDYIKYWQLYKSGVYDIAGCYDTIDHGMLVVGFDLDAHNGTGAWTIKNSWGEGWGEAGYMRAAMGLGPEPVPGKIRGIFNMYHRPARPFISKSKVINTLKLGRSELRSVYVSQL